MSDRQFRSPESHEAEATTRAMVPHFLEACGFGVRSDQRERGGQTVIAESPDGQVLTMRVRLCWRRQGGRGPENSARSYSAAQILAKVKDGDWIGSLEAKVDREGTRGVTHLLFVQREAEEIVHAALVPLAELIPIWIQQRDISARLIAEGRTGRRKKNHAMNGTSPTLWLQDDHGGEEVAKALWGHPGVTDLMELYRPELSLMIPEEVASGSEIVEGACHRILVNAYERDSKARRLCIEHHGAECKLCGFSFGTVYGRKADGYIHVHHLQPLSEVGEQYVVDSVRDLVPLCPNCHAVVHLGGKCRTLEEVQAMLRSAPGNSQL